MLLLHDYPRPEVISPAAVDFLQHQAERYGGSAAVDPTAESLCGLAHARWHLGALREADRLWARAAEREDYSITVVNNTNREFASGLAGIETVLAWRSLRRCAKAVGRESNSLQAETYAIAGTISEYEGDYSSEIAWRSLAERTWSDAGIKEEPYSTSHREINRVSLKACRAKAADTPGAKKPEGPRIPYTIPAAAIEFADSVAPESRQRVLPLGLSEGARTGIL